jgi:serine/threonine protein kinase
MHGLEIGQKFERYHVLQVLGSGVSGISYKAEDLMLHHIVTLKLIHPWSILADAARRQFFRDMQSISLLAHPSHAAVHDYGEVEGQLYIVRRFVSNGSLLSAEGRTWFSPPFSITNTLSYAHQLAQMLYHIHRYGYIHGSLTLSNILVLRGPNLVGEPDSTPFLLSDIGLAQFVRRFGHPQITRLPITAAPEQWKGRYTPASDQYALAVLIYLWLAGRPPFLGSPEEIEQAKHKASFPLLSSFNPQITLEQEGIIRRALNAHPDERYPTILAFIETLQTSLARQAKLQEQTQAHVPVPPTITYKEPVSSPEPEQPEPEQNDAQFLAEDDSEAATPNTANGSVEPISSTFLLDQNAILLLTAMAKGEKSLPEPTPTPQIEPASPLPRPEETPLPPSEPALATEQSQPKPSTSEEPVVPAPLPPAPDIAQPLPEPTLPDGESLQPSPDPQKPAEQAQTSTKFTTALIITSPYLPVPQEFYLEKEEITLGHAGSSDILLDHDQTTSRHHAMLQRKGNQYYAYDLRSDQGVIVNGQKLTPDIGHPLVDGDRIFICSYTLTLHLIPIQHDHESKKEPAIP